MNSAMTITMSSDHSPTFPSLHLHQSSFCNPSGALPTSRLFLKHVRCFTYVTAHSPTFPSLHLHQRSFCNPSCALPTSRLFLKHVRCFTYVTVNSPTLLSLLLRHRLFTYVTWRAAHVLHYNDDKEQEDTWGCARYSQGRTSLPTDVTSWLFVLRFLQVSGF